ncbi:hypothetical protein HY641_04190 [Candidatus Woesearchaeota archaeon]|nr:hypothetical protein [Candidatus Woesearchaeota archaeon]
MGRIHSADWFDDDTKTQIFDDAPWDEYVDSDELAPWQAGLLKAENDDNNRYARDEPYARDDEDMVFMLDAFTDGMDQAM